MAGKSQELGWQSISSRHLLTNNPIIIAKLKLRFLINGIEIDPVHGSLLRMTYHHNSLLSEAARFRVGAYGEKRIRDLLFARKLSISIFLLYF